MLGRFDHTVLHAELGGYAPCRMIPARIRFDILPRQGPPAMALGVADHIGTIGELVEAATNPNDVPPRYAPFTVIDGGLS